MKDQVYEWYIKSLNTSNSGESVTDAHAPVWRDHETIFTEMLLFCDQLKLSRLSISDRSRVNTGAVDEPPSFTTHFS